MTSEPKPDHDCASLRFALLRRAEAVLPDAPPASGVPARPADRRAPGAGAPDARGDLDAHLATCTGCRRELARARFRIALVGGLQRVPTPAALDGVVVAALQAGARQERAARAVADLTSVAAPDELARRIAIPRAPEVLCRLVAEDLADPAKAVASRYAGRLARLRAPADLEERLGRAARRPAARFAPLALVAFGVLLSVSALVLAHVLRSDGRGAADAPRELVLVVERVESVRDLDPVAGQLLSGFTGGLLDADRLTREEL